MQICGVGSAIDNRDPDEYVICCRLRELGKDVEIAIVVEGAGIEKFIFELAPRALAVRFDQIRIGIGSSAGICRATSCRSEWVSNLNRSNTL